MKTQTLRTSLSRRSFAFALAALLGGLTITAPLPAFADGPGIYHKWIMRGQILSLDGNTGLICVGKRDNAEVGQVLEVIRQVPVTTGGPRRSGFQPVNVGQVRIVKITNDHYSEIEVVKGDLKVNDTVELERK